jgi:hypothetical protein
MKTPTAKQIENARQTIIQHAYGSQRLRLRAGRDWAQELDNAVLLDVSWQSLLLGLTGTREQRDGTSNASDRIKLLQAVVVLEAANLPSWEREEG